MNDIDHFAIITTWHFCEHNSTISNQVNLEIETFCSASQKTPANSFLYVLRVLTVAITILFRKDGMFRNLARSNTIGIRSSQSILIGFFDDLLREEVLACRSLDSWKLIALCSRGFLAIRDLAISMTTTKYCDKTDCLELQLEQYHWYSELRGNLNCEDFKVVFNMNRKFQQRSASRKSPRTEVDKFPLDGPNS